jgi:WS/DGAT/MGAT family acyltransferase
MQQLSSLDAAFVYLETRNAPMHIGSLAVYEGPEPEFRFERYRSHIESRLHLSPVFRRRAVKVPLGLGRPYWVDDPDFDLDVHLDHVSLPNPAGWRQLRELAEDRFSTPLDLSRPLWAMTFVDGLEGIPELPPGSFGVITRIHHAAADGMGSLDMASAIWDTTPTPRAVEPPVDEESERVPGAIPLVSRSLWHLTRQPAAIARTAAGLLRGGYGMGKEWLAGGHHSPQLLFTAPRTRFNQPVQRRRTFGGVSIPLSGIAEIRKAVKGSTVNDVVLSICAGALRDYLRASDELPDESMIAMAPISLRSELESGENRVSAMLVKLATDEPDPLLRLKKVHRNTLDSKAYTEAVGASRLMDATEVVPYSLAAAASRLYSGMQVARYHRPPFNLVITNVPGPRMPLFLGGAKLFNLYGMAPVIDGLGLLVVVTSYRERLNLSVTASRNLLPNPDPLLGGIRSSYRALHAAARLYLRRRAEGRGQ